MMSDNICSGVVEQDSITKVTQLMYSAPGEGIIKEMGPIIPDSMGNILEYPGRPVRFPITGMAPSKI
jgi:hypothetical protein